MNNSVKPSHNSVIVGSHLRQHLLQSGLAVTYKGHTYYDPELSLCKQNIC